MTMNTPITKNNKSTTTTPIIAKELLSPRSVCTFDDDDDSEIIETPKESDRKVFQIHGAIPASLALPEVRALPPLPTITTTTTAAPSNNRRRIFFPKNAYSQHYLAAQEVPEEKHEPQQLKQRLSILKKDLKYSKRSQKLVDCSLPSLESLSEASQSSTMTEEETATSNGLSFFFLFPTASNKKTLPTTTTSKRIKFNPLIRVTEIRLSQDEEDSISSLWYQDEELLAFKKDAILRITLYTKIMLKHGQQQLLPTGSGRILATKNAPLAPQKLCYTHPALGVHSPFDGDNNDPQMNKLIHTFIKNERLRNATARQV